MKNGQCVSFATNGSNVTPLLFKSNLPTTAFTASFHMNLPIMAAPYSNAELFDSNLKSHSIHTNTWYEHNCTFNESDRIRCTTATMSVKISSLKDGRGFTIFYIYFQVLLYLHVESISLRCIYNSKKNFSGSCYFSTSERNMILIYV